MPLLALAVVAGILGTTAVLLPIAFMTLWFGVFAIPKLMNRLHRGSEMTKVRMGPAPRPRGLLPAAKLESPSVNGAPTCEPCAGSRVRCSRCKQPRCGEHSMEWSFYGTVTQCNDQVDCDAPASKRPPARRTGRAGKPRLIASSVHE